MRRKRKSDEVDVTPSPRRMKSLGRKRKLDAVDVTSSPRRVTRLGTYADYPTSSNDEEVFSKNKKKTKTTKATETVRKRNSKGKDTMFEGSPSSNRNEKDLRKKGSAKKLMKINSSLDRNQINRISKVGFGGLLQIKYSTIHEKLSFWLVGLFDTSKSKLVIPLRGSVKVDALAVHRLFGIPMGEKCIEYEKGSGGTSFLEFYKLLHHENDQKAPTFKEVETMLLVDHKGKFDDNWLQIWLLFAVSSLLCPTSSSKLCVRGFHAMFKVKEIKDYNWCQLVVDRLVKGIQDFKNGKKFVSGCLFFLTILYLDSLVIPNFIDEKVVPRVSVWTDDKVAQAISLDKSSANDFGKLFLKAQYSSMRNTMLIQPESVEEFFNANFTSPSITVSKDTFKQASSVLSASINQAFFTFCSQFCQVPSIANTYLPGISQHVTGATVVTEPAVTAANNTLQTTTSNVPASNTTPRGSTELLETEDHSCSGQQQEVSKDCTIEFADDGVSNTAQATNFNVVPERRSIGIKDTGAANTISDSLAGSTEILENSDDSYSGQQKEESGIIYEEKQFEREKGSSPNVVNVAGSSQSRRDDCELNNNASLELSLPSKEELERDLLGPLFETKVSVANKPSDTIGLVAAKRPATNVYSRRAKDNASLHQAAPDKTNGKATCNASSSDRLQCGATHTNNVMFAHDLGIDSPSKSQGSSTDSIKQHEAASSERRRTVPKVDTRNVSHHEATSSERRPTVLKIDTRSVSPKEDILYMLVCNGGEKSAGVTSPTIFKSKQVSATSMQLANSIAFGQCLSIVAIEVGTFVLSEDPSQVRKLIMSPWVTQGIMSSTKDTSSFVEKAFHFLNKDYDLILFPILELYESQPHASGHWFTFVINLKDNKFQVIDSARLKDNPALIETVRKFTFSVIYLWRKYTSRHAGCTVPTISNFKVHYVEGYRQFGICDCGLFTLKAIEYFDGERAPEFIGSNELNLRKQILYQWLTSPSNEMDWNTYLMKRKNPKTKQQDKTANSLI